MSERVRGYGKFVMACLAAQGVSGCVGASDGGANEGADASAIDAPGVAPSTAIATVEAHPAVAAVRTALARDAAASVRFDAMRGGLVARDGLLRAAHPRLDPTAVRPRIFARGEAFADAALTVGVGGEHSWTSRWTLSGAAHVAGALADGQAVYADALPGSDVVVAAGEHELETFVVMKDASAPRQLRWRIGRSASVVGYQPEPTGAISLVDANHLAVVRVAPSFAIDATGKRVEVPMRVEQDELVLDVATDGLAYPIVVDPVLTTAVWSLRRSTTANKDTFLAGDPATCVPAGCSASCSGGILSSMLAFSPQLGRVVSAGGVTDAPCPSTPVATWLDWDSLHGAWVRGPGTFSPPASARSAMAVAANAQNLVTLFGNAYGSSFVGDGYFHDGSNWLALCTELGGGTCRSLTTGASITCPRCLTGAPAATTRRAAAAGYVGGEWVVFGGEGASGALGDTCRGASFPLSCSTPAGSPPSNKLGIYAVDTKRGRLVVLETFLSGGWKIATWEWAPSTGWLARCGTATTSACTAESILPTAATAFDPARGVVVMVDQLDATWEWNGTTWTRTCDAGSCGLPGRSYAGFAWDQSSGRGVFAGGYAPADGHYKTDTWEYHVIGNACAEGCDTGYCVDGVCCESALCPTCSACNLAGTVGTCATVKNAGDPDTCPATTSTCDAAGACRTKLGFSCSAASECASGSCVTSTIGKVCCGAASCAAGQICQLGTGACIGDLGYACASSAQCASGNCVDGVCCDSACDSSKPCQSCKNAGNVGHCSLTIGAPTAGRGSCPTSASSDAACKQATCTGSDATACRYPGGTTSCSSTAKCASGTQSDPIGCDGKGDCGYATKACNEFACNAGATACNTTCTADVQCATGYFCSSGACVVRETQGTPCTSTAQCKSGLTCVDGVCCGSASCPSGTCNGSHPGTCTLNNGQTCTAAAQCTSSNCFDTVCCNAACGGQCQACNATGSVGICTTISGTPRNGRPACTPKSAEATCGPTSCDGSNPVACTAPTGSTSCGAASCSSGTGGFAGKCDGSGACVTPPSLACAPYVCGSVACKTTCAADVDCIAGYYCSGTSCAQKLATGLACTSASQCQSGACVDGVCCGSASCSGAAKCNLLGYKGSCMIAQGNACTTATATQCTTGFCADGVCCNQACAGTCEWCGGGGGVCAAVIGAPRAGHGACPAPGAGDPACTTSTCNGSLRTACALPSGNTCGGGCSSGRATTTGSCDGTGACAGSQTLTCAPYVCGTSACKTTCATAADCAAGSFCDATGHCAAKLPNGNTCAAGAQCGSGFCVDGVCCGSASCPAGGVCNDAGHLGACVIQQGKACVAGTPCATGSCVDGYCCNSTCAGQCEACDVAGLLGICSPVPAKGLPHGARTACVNSGADPVCRLSACDGSTRGACMLPTSATPCGSNTCSGGTFTSAGTCTGGGSCKPNVNAGCSPYVCGPTACLASCASDGDCAGGFFCDPATHLCQGLAQLGKPCTTATACGTKLFCNLADSICCEASTCPNGTCNGASPGRCTLDNGQACTNGGECTSGNCVDGVCCNTTCVGNCESCNVDAGHAGVCTPVVGAPLGGRALCPTDGTPCGTKLCNGVDTKQCNFPTSSTACGTQACAAGVETDPGSCDGKGICNAKTRACGTFLCDADACKATCATDADCVSNAFCDAAGSCQLRGAAGRPCDPAKPSACGDGLGCVDGVCCSDPDCGTHNGFCAGSHPGVCKLVNNGACAADADCNSGHCVEVDAASGKGICCDTKCDGVCETCSAPSAPGTCMPVRGAPAAGHGACPAGDGDVCSGAVCDGKGRASCDGKPGKETICQAAACAAGKANVDISCDGSGACPRVTQTYCDNFRICASATGCAQGSCAKDDDCVSGYACDVPTGKCRQKTAHCKEGDPTVAVDAVGNEQPCSPYLCDTTGVCKGQCTRSEDCAGGYVCDTEAKSCVSPQAIDGGGTNDAGGCDVGARPRQGGAAMTLLALAAAIAGRARRRREASRRSLHG